MYIETILLGNKLAGKCVIKGDDGVVRAGDKVFESKKNFQFRFILQLILKPKIITKMNLDLKVFIYKKICQDL